MTVFIKVRLRLASLESNVSSPWCGPLLWTFDPPVRHHPATASSADQEVAVNRKCQLLPAERLEWQPFSKDLLQTQLGQSLGEQERAEKRAAEGGRAESSCIISFSLYWRVHTGCARREGDVVCGVGQSSGLSYGSANTNPTRKRGMPRSASRQWEPR